jgi:hypothetical protein
VSFATLQVSRPRLEVVLGLPAASTTPYSVCTGIRSARWSLRRSSTANLYTTSTAASSPSQTATLETFRLATTAAQVAARVPAAVPSICPPVLCVSPSLEPIEALVPSLPHCRRARRPSTAACRTPTSRLSNLQSGSRCLCGLCASGHARGFENLGLVVTTLASTS